jgi:hypothetical protein
MLQVNSLVVDLKLEYMNSSSSKKIFYLLKVLDSNKHVNNRVINWYYEEGDEDALLKGQVFHEALTNTTFKFFLNRETN